MTRAVVFDLWDTVAAWPNGDPGHAELVETVGLTLEGWAAVDQRDRRWTGTFAEYLDWLGVEPRAAARAFELRTETTRRALVPAEGVLDLLDDLRARGLRLGLISNCSSEVGELWEESPFAGKFDAVILSASEGLCKPDARIYELALGRLGVEAADAVFVGDGDSGELPGAEAVGMRAVQLGERDGWHGERIATLAELRDLL
ncbi:MAG TPA: HAD-IA family hydrolase [Gaiellaceae bacterium]|nr:HAD-IA family hydrolase [Gaiellaceae bacterium]